MKGIKTIYLNIVLGGGVSMLVECGEIQPWPTLQVFCDRIVDIAMIISMTLSPLVS